MEDEERIELIESIFNLKKAKKLLQLSSVVSIGTGVCGLRR